MAEFVMPDFSRMPVVCPACSNWKHMHFYQPKECNPALGLKFGGYHCDPREGGCGAWLPSEEVAKVLFPGGARSSLSMDTRGHGEGGGMGPDEGGTMEE